jgi:methylmalonyl-CoA mutase cobalamin-binding subunit
MDVAAEHAASETVRRRLSRQFDAAGRSDDRPDIAVGMPPGGLHEIGVFAFAVACRRVGLSVAYLGADVPLESWLRIGVDPSVHALILGVVTASDAASTATVGLALEQRHGRRVCLAGGPAVGLVPGGSGVRLLPDHLDDAVGVTREVVRAGDGSTG